LTWRVGRNSSKQSDGRHGSSEPDTGLRASKGLLPASVISALQRIARAGVDRDPIPATPNAVRLARFDASAPDSHRPDKAVRMR
jgi:hypothetical protein